MSRVTSVPVWVGTFVYAYVANALSRPSVKGVLRCLAGLIVASATYVLVLLPVVLFIAPEAGRAAITYACGIALATMLGTWACSLVVLPGHRTIGMLLCIGLGMAFPVIVAALSEPTAPVRSMQYLYLIATALGGITALMAWSHRATPAAPSLGRP